MSQYFHIPGNWRHLFARHRDVKYWNTRSVDCVTPLGTSNNKDVHEKTHPPDHHDHQLDLLMPKLKVT